MVLIALAIVFAGLGAMSLSNSSPESAAQTSSDTETSETSEAPAPTSEVAPTTAEPAAPTTTLTTTTPGAADTSVPVRVLNNSTVSGLASRTGSQLTSAGFDVAETGNYPGGVIAKTTVYYGDSPNERETAEAVAKELGVSAEPRFPGIADSAPGVVVIVTGN